MRNCLTLLFIIVALNATAQTKPDKLGFSYFGQFAILPGLKVSYEKEFSNISLGSKPAFIRPELAWFTEPDNYDDYLINLELNQHFGDESKNSYWSYGIGLGYIYESKIQSFSQNLGSGNRDNTIREGFHFFHPSGNLAWHKSISTKSDLLLKYTVGYKLSGAAPNVLTMFLEVGIEIKLKTGNNE